MYSTECRNTQMLDTLAQQDEIYLMWKHCFEDCADAFREYANTQPEEIRDILWGYAECGRLMQQRLVNLACRHMEFPDETKQGADFPLPFFLGQIAICAAVSKTLSSFVAFAPQNDMVFV